LQEGQYEDTVPTVADRIAQTVVARRLEAKVEPIFHADSYGYRPGRSALDAVAVCQQRCWKHDWVIDIDVQAFFDSVDWELMLKAVVAHCTEPWVLLYVKRWLAAPLALPDGSLQARVRGTPQRSAVGARCHQPRRSSGRGWARRLTQSWISRFTRVEVDGRPGDRQRVRRVRIQAAQITASQPPWQSRRD
jgi:retron-type reverse transcriptase